MTWRPFVRSFYRLVSIAFLAVLAGCGREVPQKVENLPPLRIEPSELQLGTFKKTDKIEGTVTITNDLNEAVDLKKIILSCGCMSTGFKPKELGPGEKYTFDVSIFNTFLGKGRQQGVIHTNSPIAPELSFQMHYHVDPSASLFPDNYHAEREWFGDGSWPRTVEFEVRALDESMELLKPLYIEPDPSVHYVSAIQYSIPETNVLEKNGKVVVQVDGSNFDGGSFQDNFIVVAEGKRETMRFPIGVFGVVLPNPSDSDQP